MKSHYVYLIVNKENNKWYIGKRTTNLKPFEDIGKKYFSSSSDVDFLKEQKESPQKFSYIILSFHKSSKEALKEEKRLLLYFDVQNNNKFYNKISEFKNVSKLKTNIKVNGKERVIRIDDKKQEIKIDTLNNFHSEGYNKKNIKNCLNNLKKKYKNFYWIYEKDIHLLSKFDILYYL